MSRERVKMSLTPLSATPTLALTLKKPLRQGSLCVSHSPHWCRLSLLTAVALWSLQVMLIPVTPRWSEPSAGFGWYLTLNRVTYSFGGQASHDPHEFSTCLLCWMTRSTGKDSTGLRKLAMRAKVILREQCGLFATYWSLRI